MARVGRFLGWGACLLAAAVFAAYAFGPIDALPGMRLGGTPTDAPANWIDVNDHDDIFIETAGFPPLVVRTWYSGTDDLKLSIKKPCYNSYPPVSELIAAL